MPYDMIRVCPACGHILERNESDEQPTLLLTTLAHEINIPLQGILADVHNLQTELGEGRPELKQLAEHLRDQILRLHLLTETIMTTSSGQSAEREFAFHSIYCPLKDACVMFESEAAVKGCRILEPEPVDSEFPSIEMSLFDLTLAFKNILHNAVKYSFRPSRGSEQHRSIRVTGRWADGEHHAYSVTIQNYGVGISKEEIEKRLIFQPFYRGSKASDRRRTGAGLGLAHARQIVEDMHHGSIMVESRPVNEDAFLTSFTVILPVNQPHSN